MEPAVLPPASPSESGSAELPKGDSAPGAAVAPGPGADAEPPGKLPLAASAVADPPAVPTPTAPGPTPTTPDGCPDWLTCACAAREMLDGNTPGDVLADANTPDEPAVDADVRPSHRASAGSFNAVAAKPLPPRPRLIVSCNDGTGASVTGFAAESGSFLITDFDCAHPANVRHASPTAILVFMITSVSILETAVRADDSTKSQMKIAVDGRPAISKI